ncbi:MAG: VTT domain-containing protein [Flavobacteriaceae bacterium]|nr:VTT domain-containing protein [Flavobacteriaceae bacterium]
MPKKLKKSKRQRARLVHKYYKRTGFYLFVWESIRRAFIPIVLVILAIILFNKYVYNINEGLRYFTETFSRLSVLTVFFISETILGLIPPEIFIAWSKKTSTPILNLSILAVLSYIGGLLSYFIGRMTLRIEAIKIYLEIKMAENLKNTKKWGGILILVGALLPLPFSIACMTAGMIKYPFRNVVVLGLFRLARFALYAWAIFNVVS